MTKVLDHFSSDKVHKSVEHCSQLILLLFHLSDEVVQRLLLDLVLLARYDTSSPQGVELCGLLVYWLHFDQHAMQPGLLELKKRSYDVFDLQLIARKLDKLLIP